MPKLIVETSDSSEVRYRFCVIEMTSDCARDLLFLMDMVAKMKKEDDPRLNNIMYMTSYNSQCRPCSYEKVKKQFGRKFAKEAALSTQEDPSELPFMDEEEWTSFVTNIRGIAYYYLITRANSSEWHFEDKGGAMIGGPLFNRRQIEKWI